MIDPDLDVLARAIHGAAEASLAVRRRCLRRLGVVLPAAVLAVSVGERRAAVLDRLARGGVPVVRGLHPGMAYLFPADPVATLRALARARLATGIPVPCSGPMQLLRSIQTAIVALRSVELERHRLAGTGPDLAVESQARDLALEQLRRHGDATAMQHWLACCLHRHRTRLVAVRRRLIEFLALLSADADCDQAMDHAFRRAVETVQGTYALPELRRLFPVLVAALLPACRSERPGRDRLVAEALAICETRQGETIGLADVARRLRVSPEHLARRFRAATGRSVVAHLHELRIGRARELLASGEASILDIALACGFPSVEHFHRVFKRLTGTTPGRWRNAGQR